MTALAWFVIGYFVLSRLAYTVGVGWMLTRQRHDQVFTERYGVEEGYRRFRRLAALLMNNDGVAFVALTLVTWGTLDAPWPSRPAQITIGTSLCLLGVGVKVWAAATLGSAGYHWRDFFGPHLAHELVNDGPYRWFKNPMYTVGYAQTYGLALILGSWPALLGAAFAHAAILVFYYVVEAPHVRQLEAGQVAVPRRLRVTQTRRSARG